MEAIETALINAIECGYESGYKTQKMAPYTGQSSQLFSADDRNARFPQQLCEAF
jgi:hypothetical protein